MNPVMASDSRVSSYEYEPLNLEKNQTRLITIHPGPEESPIECDLQAFDREDMPEYITLSYTRGPSAPIQTIFVN